MGVAGEILTNLAQTGLTQSFDFSGVSPPMNAATSAPRELNKRAVVGFVTGAGVDVHLLFLQLSPEIRFTRWGRRSSYQAVYPAIKTKWSFCWESHFGKDVELPI